MKRILALLFLAHLLYVETHAQGTDGNAMAYKNTPLSPNAGSLYRSVNWPVSYSTGLVNIDIPLYEIKTGDMVLPVSISYRASGLKVNHPAGIVGLGWSLNAEPAVSRQVKQGPDEGTAGYLTNNNLDISLIRDNNYYIYDWANGYKDEEPDDFYYRTLRSSGQFYYQRNNLSNASAGSVIIPKPLAPIKISKLSDRYEVVESNGDVYEYPDSTAEIIGTPSLAYKSAWKVGRIKSSSSNKEIGFKYEPYTKDYTFAYTYNISLERYVATENGCILPQTTYCSGAVPDYELPSPIIRKNIDGQSNLQFIDRYDHTLVDLCAPGDVSSSRFSQTVLDLRNIRQIDFDNGKVVFEYWKRADQGIIQGAATPSNNSYMIQNITVFEKQANGTFQQMKKIVFFQNSTTWNREKLDSIQVKDANNVVVETYKFDYDGQALPVYPYPYSDHWGNMNTTRSPYASLYTGVIYTAVNVQTTPCVYYPYDSESSFPENLELYIGDLTKTINEDLVGASILKKITYPTGGYTTFDYEPNEWMQSNGDSIKGGGLRIKTISNYASSTDQPTIRSFKYGIGENGKGIGWDLNVNDYIIYKHISYPDGMLGVGVRGSNKQTYMPNSFYDYFFAEGTPVVYNTVHEYIGTPGTNIGKNVYEYDYNEDYLYQTRFRRSFVSPLVDDYRNSFLFGSLLGKSVYKVVNGNYVLQQKNGYQYEKQTNGDTRAQVRQVYIRSDMAGGGNLGSYNPTYEENYEFDYSLYFVNSGLKRLLQETDTTLENGVYLTNKRVYEYDATSVYQPRKIKEFNSKGDSIVRTNTYPTDLHTDPVYSAMITRNMVSPVIEEVAKKNDITELSRKKINYNNSFTRILPVSMQNSILGNPLETEVTFNQYDAQGNLLEYLDKSGITTSIIWGYNYSFPVARITGSSYSAAQGVINISALQTLTGHALRDALNPLYTLTGSLVNVYTYEPLKGLSSQTDPSGKIMFYEYDGFGRLKVIKDQEGKILKQYDYQYKVPVTQ